MPEGGQSLRLRIRLAFKEAVRPARSNS